MGAVAGVRVGDVLTGTKNLRRWLRAASLTEHARECLYNGFPINAKQVYLPNRNDEFVVATNQDQSFIVWSERGRLFIPFISPGPEVQGVPARMNGQVFSQWFVRTDRRCANVREWPSYAQIIWRAANFTGHAGMGLDLFAGPYTDKPNWRYRQVFTRSRELPEAKAWNSPSPMHLRANRRFAIGASGPKLTGIGPRICEIPHLEREASTIMAEISRKLERKRARSAREVMSPGEVAAMEAKLAKPEVAPSEWGDLLAPFNYSPPWKKHKRIKNQEGAAPKPTENWELMKKLSHLLEKTKKKHQ